MGRRQAAPGKATASATGAQTANNPMMEILMDLSSPMSATEELLAMHKETESKYLPARSVRDDTGAVQSDWQPNNLALCTEGELPEVAQETHRQEAHA